ncbi:CAP domain-containing protein [Wenzhouxiangella marina]|uniref:Uncharacterized protein n=1 Tax=Wenzhouxiangella marina TaxID=1579979 RepID=A0A0K0XZC3_9GAMM|nr:CAP domain-containing protein [Wenzhouxiangella marina]AKS43034.1 hypothetical protein WM2015_2676 [Wenzhouxiangella marina]MBB6087283.1 hypothetical protein [Wenzhouxiangella marina]
MKLLRRGTQTFSLLVGLAACQLVTAGSGPEPGTCIDPQEFELAALINQYRADNALPAIPVSTVLTTVAQWHGEDARLNGGTIFGGGCNLHSWSTTRPELWVGGCYLPDHSNASLMWEKPNEISAGSYTATGFEIAYVGQGVLSNILTAWQNSPGHNAVLLNEGVWENYSWQAMGVGLAPAGDDRYAYVWFSTAADPSAPLDVCAMEPMIFDDRFEQLLP